MSENEDTKTCGNCIHYNEFSIYQDNCEAHEYCIRDNHGEASGATKDLWKSPLSKESEGDKS